MSSSLATPAPRRYDAILFDVGGTLLDVTHDPRERAVAAVAHLGTVSAAAFDHGIRRAVEEWRAAGGRPEAEDLTETWFAHNRRALSLAGFEGDLDAAARLMEDTFLSDGWEVFSDVAATLEILGGLRYRLAAVSNWPSTLDATLERAGLRRHFAVVVSSGVVGYAKPHPEIFRIAIAGLGTEPRRALLVGDSVELDLEGAAAAGMDAVLLDRTDRHPSRRPRIRSLEELPELLGADPVPRL